MNRDDPNRPFLSSIRANPKDDLPRLVYADALEGGDEGLKRDPDRAEFIRLQCEMGRGLTEHRIPTFTASLARFVGVVENSGDMFGSDFRKMELRACDLLRNHAHEWCPWAGGTWVRGFLETVRIPQVEWFGGSRHFKDPLFLGLHNPTAPMILYHNPCVTRVDIVGCKPIETSVWEGRGPREWCWFKAVKYTCCAHDTYKLHPSIWNRLMGPRSGGPEFARIIRNYADSEAAIRDFEAVSSDAALDWGIRQLQLEYLK